MGKILVIDSDKVSADLCSVVLGSVGNDVVCVSSSEEAIEKSQRVSFDLAIVSLTTGDNTGIATFKSLRRSNPTLAGILVSQCAELESVIEAMNSGFSRICKKPVMAEQISEAVRETLKFTELRTDVTRMKTLIPLYNLGKNFLEAKSEQAIYDLLTDVVSQEIDVPKVSVMMFDDQTETLKVVSYRGIESRFVENIEVRPGEQIAGKVFVSESPVILNRDGKEAAPYVNLLKRKELAAAISFPIASKGKVLGVLNVSETRGDTTFSDADIEMLSIISDQAMMALENIRSIQEREEQNRIRTLMEQYVSPEVSSMLCGSSQELMDQGSVQDLTILFADIRSFTLLVQQLPPEQTRTFLNGFFEIFSTTIFAEQGMLDKFMGDAALVVFGAPVKVDNSAAVAVTAAQKIMSAFSQLQQLWCKKDKAFEEIGLGIGISRGPIFLGNVGSEKRLDYTVIGTDVNIAQRLASEAESGQILITESVHEKLGDSSKEKLEQPMALRGIESDVIVYSL